MNEKKKRRCLKAGKQSCNKVKRCGDLLSGSELAFSSLIDNDLELWWWSETLEFLFDGFVGFLHKQLFWEEHGKRNEKNEKKKRNRDGRGKIEEENATSGDLRWTWNLNGQGSSEGIEDAQPEIIENLIIETDSDEESPENEETEDREDEQETTGTCE